MPNKSESNGSILQDEIEKKVIKDKGIEWVGKNSRLLLIFDDMIAEKNFLNSQETLMMFTLLRHYLCGVVICSQSFKKIPRAIRINANWLCIFPSLESEIQIMLDEICPSGVTKKEFRKIIDYCTTGKYDFMSIQNHAEPNQRIRKNLSEIIDIKKYIG